MGDNLNDKNIKENATENLEIAIKDVKDVINNEVDILKDTIISPISKQKELIKDMFEYDMQKINNIKVNISNKVQKVNAFKSLVGKATKRGINKFKDFINNKLNSFSKSDKKEINHEEKVTEEHPMNIIDGLKLIAETKKLSLKALFLGGLIKSIETKNRLINTAKHSSTNLICNTKNTANEKIKKAFTFDPKKVDYYSNLKTDLQLEIDKYREKLSKESKEETLEKTEAPIIDIIEPISKETIIDIIEPTSKENTVELIGSVFKENDSVVESKKPKNTELNTEEDKKKVAERLLEIKAQGYEAMPLYAQLIPNDAISFKDGEPIFKYTKEDNVMYNTRAILIVKIPLANGSNLLDEITLTGKQEDKITLLYKDMLKEKEKDLNISLTESEQHSLMTAAIAIFNNNSKKSMNVKDCKIIKDWEAYKTNFQNKTNLKIEDDNVETKKSNWVNSDSIMIDDILAPITTKESDIELIGSAFKEKEDIVIPLNEMPEVIEPQYEEQAKTK